MVEAVTWCGAPWRMPGSRRGDKCEEIARMTRRSGLIRALDDARTPEEIQRAVGALLLDE